MTVDSNGERGLLGVAFDPDFATNQFVYVYYTVPGADAPQPGQPVHRRRATSPWPAARRSSSTSTRSAAATNHNGGAIHFGPDGKLYVAVGENANAANAQSLRQPARQDAAHQPRRLDPDRQPFFTAPAVGANRAIWALGLRNPFTFAFQPGTGRMFINDVGRVTFEEINDGVAGANYGWPESEGPDVEPRPREPPLLYAYGAGGTRGCAITGGTFYNPAVQPFPADYVGDYFFSDLCNGWIRRLDPATGTAAPFATGISNPVDLKVGPDGLLYYLARGTASVWKVQFGDGTPNAPPTATISDPASGTLYNAGDTIEYAGSASDPEDGPLPPSALTWQVDFHHDGSTDTFVPPTTGSATGSFTIPDTGETSANVFYRIVLTARDSGGLAHVTFVDVVPRLSTLTLATDPPGLRITLDGEVITTPAAVESVVGMRRVLGPVSPQFSGGTSYAFESWSDGGAATHTIVTPSSDTTYTATYAAQPTPAGVGLAGFYYDNSDFTGTFRTRLDPTVDFTWPGAPITGIGPDAFSVRWTGQVRAKVTGTHTFYTTTDGGVKLWVNNVLVIGNWAIHPATENSGTINLAAGQLYDVRLDYRDTIGTAVVRLSWSAPGVDKEVVPPESLYPYALLVVGSTTLGVGDAAVRDRMLAGGLIPVLVPGPSAATGDAIGKAVIAVSSTVNPASVTRTYRTAITPVVVWESALFDDFAMTGAPPSLGTEAGQTDITITKPEPPSGRRPVRDGHGHDRGGHAELGSPERQRRGGGAPGVEPRTRLRLRLRAGRGDGGPRRARAARRLLPARRDRLAPHAGRTGVARRRLPLGHRALTVSAAGG